MFYSSAVFNPYRVGVFSSVLQKRKHSGAVQLTAGKKQGQDLKTVWPDLKARMLGFIILPLCIVVYHVLIIKKKIVYYSILYLFCHIFSTLWCVCRPQITFKYSGLLSLFYSWGQNVKIHPFKLLHLEWHDVIISNDS